MCDYSGNQLKVPLGPFNKPKMECQKEKNLESCTCTYPGCEKKGICCECVRFHRERRELPGCFFPQETEKTFDRSIQKFVELNS